MEEFEIKMALIKIAKKIEKIEDEDINYFNNPKYKALREQQNELFKKLERYEDAKIIK